MEDGLVRANVKCVPQGRPLSPILSNIYLSKPDKELESRHKVRVIIIKQWKHPRTIYRNLMKLNKMFRCGISDVNINKCADARLGWYSRANGDTVNFMLIRKFWP